VPVHTCTKPAAGKYEPGALFVCGDCKQMWACRYAAFRDHVWEPLSFLETLIALVKLRLGLYRG
jgi:hypothetical protein